MALITKEPASNAACLRKRQKERRQKRLSIALIDSRSLIRDALAHRLRTIWRGYHVPHFSSAADLINEIAAYENVDLILVSAHDEALDIVQQLSAASNSKRIIIASDSDEADWNSGGDQAGRPRLYPDQQAVLHDRHRYRPHGNVMPGMDGHQTIEMMRRNAAFRHLPIIALTAKAMKGDRENCPRPALQTLSPNRSLPSSFYRPALLGAPLGGPNHEPKRPDQHSSRR